MYGGTAAIHVAVIESYLPIVRLLIEYKADLNKKVCSYMYRYMYIMSMLCTST